ncbi:hypothetical protein AGR9A_Lc10091 [Agrobacterium salinitolerans str. Hayward 0363]|nr:hypothetical protein AGR9A_Lc10091 [Agrobacterium salinitolerans str. Hayward 0363]
MIPITCIIDPAKNVRWCRPEENRYPAEIIEFISKFIRFFAFAISWEEFFVYRGEMLSSTFFTLRKIAVPLWAAT